MAQNIGQVVNELIGLEEGHHAIVRKNGQGLYVVDVERNNEFPYVELTIAQEDREYGIIHVSKPVKGFFPGYRRQFVLQTDLKPFVMHLTAASEGTAVGDVEGGYICHPRPTEIDQRLLEFVPDTNDRIAGSFKRFYDAHEELTPNDTVLAHRISPRFYQLTIPTSR